ncbi:MAG: DNA mismatch repair endonuclease MutL [Lachnospiraceae bacterium]|nr:DNA mismatch repair endonuclease MutL [Lachnospiraceae bacterium]
MAEIRVLDSGTIDKIAAGEVVERPASVVKELTENAVDAGSSAVTVEIKEGGISFIRVTDNGSGIEASQVRNAFLRHATSKIASAEDLHSIKSLGFRGEALSSICAVAKVELITKTKDSLTGIRYLSEGADEKEFSEVGAPDGTTIIVRNLFFNTPVRRKFLKQPQTEGSYIIDLMEHMALSRPDVSFKLIVNGQVKFHTLGNGDLKEVIYRIYGREAAANLVEIRKETPGIAVSGYLGKPVLNRANRNFENYAINGRYIKSSLLAKAIEDGYSQYLMQHKFPFTVLHFTVDTELVDVNVHPTKMDVRFTEGKKIYDFVAEAVAEALRAREMIPEAVFSEKSNAVQTATVPEKETAVLEKEAKSTISVNTPETAGFASKEQEALDGTAFLKEAETNRKGTETIKELKRSIPEPFETKRIQQFQVMEETRYEAETQAAVQMNLFEEKLLSKDNREDYRILGQIFDTYWLIAFKDKLFIVDQHAAHEKVKYERLIRQLREKEIVSQSLNPPIVVTLSAKEEQVFAEHSEVFVNLGFEIENFGGSEYTLRGVPADLYGCDEKALFLEVLDELSLGPSHKNLTVVEEKLASMACKAAVKGNHSLNAAEMEALLDELLTLDNPYNCPHGRPTIISMSKYEIEKKFKRIV